ncbi:hypothetical protein I552_7100 [Mycobacterium xenopi 3993]|nr:hypothetical protein I552_7100 [Mycobacterium xenopi 3993]
MAPFSAVRNGQSSRSCGCSSLFASLTLADGTAVGLDAK